MENPSELAESSSGEYSDEYMSEDDEDSEGEDNYDSVGLSAEVLDQLRHNDPDLTGLEINDASDVNPEFCDWEKNENFIANNTHLTCLDVSLEEVEDEINLQNFKALLKSISRNRTIKHFSVDFRALNLNDTINSIEVLSQFFEHNTNLRGLDINNVKIERNDQRGAQVLATCISNSTKSLRRLGLYCYGHQLKNETARVIAASLDAHKYNLRELTLNLNNNGKEWCIELSKLLGDPATKLGTLDLSYTDISDEGAIILGMAVLQNTTLNKLFLNRLRSFSSLAWTSLISGLGGSSSLEEVDLSLENCIGSEGIVSLANSLVTNTSLEVFNLKDVCLTAMGVAALAYALGKNSTLTRLDISNNITVSNVGWQNFFNLLRNNNSTLEILHIDNNNIVEQDVRLMVDCLGSIGSLTQLRVKVDSGITTIGWQTLSSLLQHPNLSLEYLYIGNTANDVAMVAFANSLTANTTLEMLEFVSVDTTAFTPVVWDTLINLLCDDTNLESISNSNHTLNDLCLHGCVPAPLSVLLGLNQNANKTEVVRQKIINYYFLNGENNMEEFVDMEVNVLPHVIAWTGRDGNGFSLLYCLVQSMPSLFDPDSKAAKLAAAGSKRKFET